MQETSPDEPLRDPSSPHPVLVWLVPLVAFVAVPTVVILILRALLGS